MNLLKYTLLRFGIMLVVFFLCIFLKIGLVFSAIFAVIIALAACYLGFPHLHVAAGEDMARLFKGKKSSTKRSEEETNREIEDAYVDSKFSQE
ncbi:DUF4229 domain-containing protein [Rothia terrae]|uniref:DUF4229 domain-containing protein n=1 Tax=Rothia terrae TaxID=396015 RepID=UPI0033EBF893